MECLWESIKSRWADHFKVVLNTKQSGKNLVDHLGNMLQQQEMRSQWNLQQGKNWRGS
jgi:hypothetical protein